MNIKREVLTKLGLEMLIGTDFEEMIKIEEYKKKEVLPDINHRECGAVYLYTGWILSTIYSSEGNEVYRYYEEGAVIGTSESLSEIANKHYGIDFEAAADSTIVYLPFKELFNKKIEASEKIYRQLFNIIAIEKSEDTGLIIGRLAYSDEEFLLKALENRKFFDVTSIELAKALNIKLRNLQRYFKMYVDLGIIEKERGRVAIKDIKKFNEYKMKILK